MKRGETTSFIITVILLTADAGVLTWLALSEKYVFAFLAGFILIMLFSLPSSSF